MSTPLYTFEVKDQATIRDDILRTQRNGLIARGVPSPNVTPDSDAYVQAQSFANELAVVEANAVIKADELMPDTATGDALLRQGAPYGLEKRAAAGSTGFGVANFSQTSAVAAGLLLTDGAGLTYQVTQSGSYASGALIPVAAVSTGAATNLAAGSPLRWANAPAYSDSKMLVSTGGLVNGNDAEDDETFRARLYALLQNPPECGNDQHVAMIAEAASASVQKAYVYPAVQGAATVHVAVTAAPTATNKNRDVATVTMTGTVVPYVTGQLPAHVAATTTTVTNVNTDVSIGLALPAARTASPPGLGGGWLDGTPWPSVDGVTYFVVVVTAAASSTVFTVDAQTAPVDGVSRIAWLSPIDWTLYTATVLSHTGTAGAYVITIDSPFPSIAADHYVFPQSANQATYVAALLAHFQLMGPGEKSSNASALQRGFRRPVPALSWPYSLNDRALKAIESTSDEVDSATFLARSWTTPAVPAAVTDPPKILVPRNLAFYPIA